MNKKVILKQRPVGEPKLEDFELFEEDIRDPKDCLLYTSDAADE